MIELICFISTLVLVSGFMSLFEVSIFSCSTAKLTNLTKRHKHLSAFLKKPKEIPAAIMVTNIMIDVAGASYGGTMAYKLFGEDVRYTIYTVTVTLMLLMFSTLLPKLYASSHAESVLRVFGRVILFIYHVTRPFVAVLYFFIKPFLKTPPEDGITRSEVKAMMTLAESSNIIGPDQSQVIDNALSINKKQVIDLLPPEPRDLATVDINATVGDESVIDIINHGKHKRYVVTHSHEGHAYAVGVVLYSDLIQAFLAERRDTKVTDLMHPASTTFDSDNASLLLKTLDKNIDHITVVINKENQHIIGVIQANDIIKYLVN